MIGDVHKSVRLYLSIHKLEAQKFNYLKPS